MYESIHKLALVLHIAIGSAGLVIFWLPIFSKKGGAFHKQAGNWFAKGMTIVAYSGILMSTLVFIDPLAVRDPNNQFTLEQATNVVEVARATAAFLFMLSCLVLCTTRQGINVLKAKDDRSILKTPAHLVPIFLLMLSAVYVGMLSFQRASLLYPIFSVLSFFVAIGMLKYIFRAEVSKRTWIIEHVTNIIASGIAAYTAFLVFGGQSFLAGLVPSNMQIMFWIMPGVVGGFLSHVYASKYRKIYNVK
ncbi:hypothetical protein [Psychrosphaera haliotis]|uniref:DUF2306 domain-containing protein n=1 Tax=Psychrosphaera haliotis TaxID=555083 RepID=A0A6N8F768_9GAMM|nr:hypothetical protein [Psychrosphaera haliotis]MUH72233.1 hypothetical protein [Psychrosphaera haliotis]